MAHFTQVTLFTDTDGRARFREDAVPLTEGTPQAQLSALRASGGYQLRESPVGFRSAFHCTVTPQWVFILRGRMEIGLQDGTSRVFAPGDDRLAEPVQREAVGVLDGAGGGALAGGHGLSLSRTA